MASCELTFRSSELSMDVKVTVIIPENRRKYELIEGKKYKALYILHGHSEDNSSWMNSSNLYVNVRDLDCYVFMVSAYNSAYINTSYDFKMHDYLVNELPIRMANIFPISLKREDNYLMGESMGGYGCWYTGFTNPEKYSKIVPLSLGPGDPEHPFRLMGKVCSDPDSEEYNICRLLKKQYDAGKELPEVFTMCGTEDFGYETTKLFMAYVEKECPNLKIKAEYWSGKHDFFFWNEAIPKAIEFLGLSKNQENANQL